MRLAHDVGHFGLAATEQCHGNGCDGDDARNEADDDADGLLARFFLRIVVHAEVRCLLHGARVAWGKRLHDRGASLGTHDRGSGAHDAGRRRGRACACKVERTTHEEVIQGVLHIAHGLEAVGGVFLHGLHDDGLKVGADVGLHLARRQRRLVDLAHGDTHGIGAVKGELPGCGFVEHAAEGVHVACAVELFALSLLGRDVVGGTEHAGGLGFHAVFGARDAEVHDLHVAVGLHHDVLRLDVAVHDVLAVGDGKRLADLAANFSHLALVDGATLLNGGLQVGAAHVFHDDEIRAAVLAPVVYVDDVGALQVCCRSCFLFEAGGEFGVCCILRQHDLDCHRAAEDLVLCFIYLGHASYTDAFGNLVPLVEHPSYHVSLLYVRLVAYLLHLNCVPAPKRACAW